MKEDKDFVLSKGFIPYMAKVLGFIRDDKFVSQNINELEGLSLDEMRELLLSDVDAIKALDPNDRDFELQKLFTKIYSFQPNFIDNYKRELKSTEQRLYADIVLTPGFLDDEVVRDFLLNRFKANDKNSLKHFCLLEIIETLDNLSLESKEKFAFCFRSSSKFANALLTDDRYFSKLLNDRNLSMFNKATFSQLFRFSGNRSIDVVISQLLFDSDDKSLFMISQMCNYIYEQVGHTSEFILSVGSILSAPNGKNFKAILSGYYDRVIGNVENEKEFKNAIKDELPYELREILNVVCEYTYTFIPQTPLNKIDNLDDFLEHVKSRRLSNHKLVFGEEGLRKYIDGTFSINDFKNISSEDELALFKEGILQNIYGISLSQAKYFVSRYGNDLDKLSKSILESDKTSFEILKSLSSISSLSLDNVDGINLLQSAYLKYMYEKGIDFQKSNSSCIILEGLFNRMYMNTYSSILYNDLSNVLYVDDGVSVFDAGVDFNMIVTSINGTKKYFENGMNMASKWNTAFRDNDQGLCTSFINNQNLGVISLNGPLLGFSNIHEDALNTMGVTDIYSDATYFNLRKNNRSNKPFIVGQEMANETRFGYNEILFDRFNTKDDGEVKIQPSYVVFYKTQDDYKTSKRYVETLKTAKDFGIPIVIVDFDKVQMHERDTIRNMEEQLFSSDTVDKDLLVGIMTRYMNNISGCRTIHGPTSLKGLGVSKYVDFPEKALGEFIDSVLYKCDNVLDGSEKNKWIDALQEAYDNEKRKHIMAISVLSYHCSIGEDNDDFILLNRFNLAERLIDVHNRYGKVIREDEASYREGEIPFEVNVLSYLSKELDFNTSYEVSKVITFRGKSGYSVTKNVDSKDISLEEKIIIAYLTDNYKDDLLSDITDSKKDKIYFGTSKEIVDKTINNISLIDRLSNSYLGEEVRRKGIDMDKVNSYLDKLDSMEEKKYLSIFNDYIYHVKEKTAFSQLYIADKFLEKKNSIREEFNKLNASLNLSSDDIKSK